MLNSVLWLAFITAGVASMTAFVVTQSFFWGFVAYSGAGMAVLMALLITELAFGEPMPDSPLDEPFPGDQSA